MSADSKVGGGELHLVICMIGSTELSERGTVSIGTHQTRDCKLL